MDLESPLYSVFGNILLDLPGHLVRLAGIVLCFIYWRRYPRACLLALIGLLLLYLQIAIAVGSTLWMQAAIRRSSSATEIGMVFRVLAFIQSLIVAVGLGFLLAAIFWRGERPGTT